MKPYIILILLVTIVYANSLQNQFVWDDVSLIVDNPKINLPIREIPSLFTTSLWEMAGFEGQQTYYRPIISLLLVLNYKIWGLNPSGFHMTNIILHLINVIILYKIGLLLFNNDALISFIGASIFAVHPVNNEPVGRVAPSEVVVGFFIIISIYFFLKENKYLSLFTFFLALLTKESAVMLPFALVILAIHKNLSCYVLKREGFKKGIIAIIPYIALVGIYIFIRVKVVDVVLGADIKQPILTQILTMAVAAFDYTKLFIIPFPLSPYYSARWHTSILEPKVILAIIILASIAFLAYRIRRDKAMFLCLTFPFIMLAPVVWKVNMVLASSYIAERYLYVPAMLSSLFVSAYTTKLFKDRLRQRLVIGWILVITVFTVITVSVNKIWKDDNILFTTILRKEPDSFLAGIIHYNRGLAYKNIGEIDKAMQEWQRVIEIYPPHSSAHNSIGNVYLSRGDYLMAITAYKDAINADPNNAEAHYNLSLTLEKVGKKNEAIYEYLIALKLNPELKKSIKTQESK